MQSVALVILAILIGLVGIGTMHASALADRISARSDPGMDQAGTRRALRWRDGDLHAAGAGRRAGAMVLDLGRDMPALLVLTVVVLKLVACTLSLASGFRGGLFFASLFVGSLLGKLYAIVLAHWFRVGLRTGCGIERTDGNGDAGSGDRWRALTMAFLVLEMTNDFHDRDRAGGLHRDQRLRARVVRAPFSTWRALTFAAKRCAVPNDIGWLRSLTVSSMMRTDLATVRSTATIAECRKQFRLGSHQALFVTDERNAYRGVVMLPDVFSSDLEGSVDQAQITSLARYPDTALVGSMNVTSAMKCFEQGKPTRWRSSHDEESGSIIGFLSEAYARRRYIEELNRATGNVTQEADA